MFVRSRVGSGSSCAVFSVMSRLPLVVWLSCLGIMPVMNMTVCAGEETLLEPLRRKVREIACSIGEVPPERRELLDEFASLIAERVQRGEAVAINFICTHNSRRSHLGQVWAQTAVVYYDIPGVSTFSGGIETTACNQRTVRALRRAGFSVVQMNDGDNPHYLLQFSERQPPLLLFSKIYDAAGNPQTGYLAAMCCSDADERCPMLQGADARVSLSYEDPKIADDTPEESLRYDERSRQIAREMFYVMSRVQELLAQPSN